MTLSKLLTDGKSRISFRPSWRVALSIGLPVLAAGVAGYYYLKTRSVVPEPDSLPKTPLDAAISLKNRGNRFFKAGQYAKAIQLYDDGLTACPEDAVTERAALYQNRAAAKENLRQYESAVEDCNLALELSPRYLKALNRRAHLYQKLEMWDECLPDVTACCIFEEFKNTDNIILMDQTLKTIGQRKAEEEWAALPRSLPSASFIRTYLSAFSCDPFEKTALVLKTGEPVSNGINATKNSVYEETNVDQPESNHASADFIVVEPFQMAQEKLHKALDFLTTQEYSDSMEAVTTAVQLFEKAFSKTTTNTTSNHMAEGDEATTNGTVDKVLDDSESHMVRASLTSDELAQAKNVYCKAVLLYATYLALSGYATEAKQKFQTVAAEGSGADWMTRVNALIKLACLSMSVNQDVPACLYEFQTAQSVRPDCPDIYLHRGQINLIVEQLDEALHDFNMAVKLKPEFTIAQAQRLYTLYRKALCESNSERASSRVEEFRRLAQKHPNCAETHSLFAQVLTECGEFSASDAEFAKLIDLAPDSGLPYAHRGLLHLRLRQDRDAAHKWFTLGAEADPKCELIHELLGQLAVEQGDFTTAMRHFDAAIRETKIKNELVHLVALREGVTAQYNTCETYGLPISDVVNSLRRVQQQMLMNIG